MFTVKIKGKNVKLDTLKPTQKQESMAMKSYYRVYNARLEQGAPLRMQVMDILKTRGLWSEEKEAKVVELQKDVTDKEYTLEAGGIKLSVARDVALDLLHTRNTLADLLTSHNELDNITVEAQADNAKFNHLVSLCTIDNKTKEPHFKSLDDYENPDNVVVATLAGEQLYSLIYNTDSDFISKLPEHVFLKEYKLVNDDGQLVDKDGQLVNRNGDRLDKEGYLINDKNERISSTGKKLDEKGNFIVEHKPFLDDKGNEI